MKKNILFALAVILLAGVIAVTRVMTRTEGRRPAWRHGRGDDHPAAGQDGTYEISEGKLPVTLEVSEGRIRFINSRCPDHICEGYGWLSKEHDQAVCMPAGVVVSVEKGA
ncbi:MAG: NusG domain II-containing protein [Ruthenibacterium lactatiformans]